jgi:serine/threonine protein kinase
MSISIPEFWQRAIDVGVLSREQCQRLGESFGKVKGAAQQGNASTLAMWVAAEGEMTSYQATLLASDEGGTLDCGDYRLTDLLTAGPLSGTFRATHRTTGHPVMLQFCEAAAGDANSRAETLKRAIAACAMMHPQVSRCYDYVAMKPRDYAVLEDMQGQTLEEQLAAGGAIEPGEACRIIYHTTLGLAQLHALGHVHGLVQPKRIWLEPSGNVRLLQAPLSRDPFTPPSPLDRSSGGEAADYLAPELITPGRQPDMLCDMYSLGCTFYELVTGNVPFAGSDLAGKLAQHSTQSIAALDQQGIVSPTVAAIITYLMAKDPAQRYQTADEVAEMLRSLLDPPAQTAPAPVVVSTQVAFDAGAAARQAAMMAQHEQCRDQCQQEISASQPFSFDLDTSLSRARHGKDAPQETGVATSVIAAEASAEDDSAEKKDVRPLMKNSHRNGLFAALAAGCILLAALIVVALSEFGDETPTANGQSDSPAKTDDPNGTEVTSSDNPPPLVQNGVSVVEIPDDGTTLWSSPTSGKPLVLAHVPAGAQLLIVARPAAILATDSGQRAWGPDSAASAPLRRWIQSTVGVPLEQIRQMTVTAHGRGEVGLTIYPVQPKDPDEWLALWGDPEVFEHSGETYYERQGLAYYVADDGAVVITPPIDMQSVIDQQGSAPLLVRHMEELVATSDADRHISAFFLPVYLQSRGDDLFVGHTRAVASPVGNLLGKPGEVVAAAASLHFGEEVFFGELRLSPGSGQTANGLNKAMLDRINAIPAQLSAYCQSIEISPHSRGLLWRFPQMVAALVSSVRSDVENRQTVLRFLLPQRAAHNFVLGTDLALYEGASGGSAARPTQPVARTVREKLQQPITLSFPKESLEAALSLFAREAGVEVQILGADLQLDGITKNQAIVGFSVENRPAVEVLRAILLKANPDPDAKKLTDPAMKLVYVIKPKSGRSGEVVYVTTRDAVAKRGDSLPPEFKIP